MASIQSLGVGSGLLTSDLVEDIIAAEREATDLRLSARRAEFDAKISAFGSLQSQVDTLNTAASALGSSSSLLLNTATSTDETVVTAAVDATATPAIHTVEVTNTARIHTLTSIRYDSSDTIVGDGTMDIRFGTTTYSGGNYDTFTENTERASASISIDSSNNTLDGIRDAINAADIGVQASIVDDGEGFLLVLTSDRSGVDHSMEITVTEGSTAGLSDLNFNATAATPGTNFTQSVAASDAQFTIDGIDITRETNTVTGVIAGVTFNLLSSNSGSEATIAIGQDTAAITENMQTFVDAYNNVKSFADELTNFDAEENVSALLTGDSTIRNLMAQLRRFMSQTVAEVESTSLRALIDLGISTNQNFGFRLQLSSTTFQQALQANPADVLALLADQSRASDSQISFIGFANDTQAGTYEVDITQTAAQALLSGEVVAGLAGAITVDDDNDTLSIIVDGTTSATVTLAQGSYTDGSELAQELQAQINQDATLRDAGRAVEVSYDTTNQRLEIRSTQFGANSSVGIASVDTNTESDFGLAVVAASTNTGVDVAGSVNNIQGTGVGQFLSIPTGAQAATAGSYEGTGVTTFATLPFTIDTDNDTFRISVDGTLTSDVVLTNASYATADELASEIQSQINADALLTGAQLSVTVAYQSSNERFVITSDSSGTSSSVNLTYAEAGVVSDLGLAVAVGTPGKAASTVSDAAAGVRLQVQGTSVGERGSVTLVRGIMNKLDTYLQQFTQFGGSLRNRLDGLNVSVTKIDEESVDFSARMDLLEDRLRLQFAAADALISTLNSTSSFLDQQLATLPGYTNDSN